MEKIVISYVVGLPKNATQWEIKRHKKYGSLRNICNQVRYDIRHGVTNEQVMLTLKKIKSHSSFATMRRNAECMERLSQIESHLVPSSALAVSSFTNE